MAKGGQPGDGPLGPSFTRDFPRDPELDELVRAFERGDYRRVREGAPSLLARTEDEAVRRAARELSARIEPAPLGRGLILVAAVLLIALAAFYLSHQHRGV